MKIRGEGIDFVINRGPRQIYIQSAYSIPTAENGILQRMTNINWTTVALLTFSNLVMLYAWYGHLRNLSKAPIWMTILISWIIALGEYCLMVPANRIGSKTMSLEQLKIVQEAIALLTFVPFSIVVMKESVSLNYAAAALCIFAAVYFIFKGPFN